MLKKSLFITSIFCAIFALNVPSLRAADPVKIGLVGNEQFME